MEVPQIAHDDLMDVMELTDKLEDYIGVLLKGNARNIAISVLMSASINCLLSQCTCFNEVVFYRNLFMQILDTSIKDIQIKETEK